MHAKVFSIEIFQHFHQIPPRVCTLVLFILEGMAVLFWSMVVLFGGYGCVILGYGCVICGVWLCYLGV